MAFLAEHVKKLTDDIRASAEARTAALTELRTEAGRIQTAAKALVTGAREALAAQAEQQRAALSAGSTGRATAVRGLLSGFATTRATRHAKLKEQQAAARAARQEAVAALRQQAREVREQFANDRQLAARAWHNLRAARRPGA